MLLHLQQVLPIIWQAAMQQESLQSKGSLCTSCSSPVQCNAYLSGSSRSMSASGRGTSGLGDTSGVGDTSGLLRFAGRFPLTTHQSGGWCVSLVLQDQGDEEFCVAQTLALSIGLGFVAPAGPLGVEHLAVHLERRRTGTVSELRVLFAKILQLLCSSHALGRGTDRWCVRIRGDPIEQLLVPDRRGHRPSSRCAVLQFAVYASD